MTIFAIQSSSKILWASDCSCGSCCMMSEQSFFVGFVVVNGPLASQ